MKNHLLLLLFAAGFWLAPQAGFAQSTAPDLGAASSFAFFTAVGAFDNVGPSVIKGDIGTNAGAFSGFPPGVVTGEIHVADTRSTQVATDVQSAFAQLSEVSCVVPLAVYGGPVSDPQTLTPNSYCVSQATTLAGSLILDGQGNPNALFFLRVSGALTTAEGSTVTLINGASADNVFWQVTGRTDLGMNSFFRGNLVTDGAINLVSGARLEGRALSRGGAITIDTGIGTEPSFLAPEPEPIVTTTFWLGNPLGTGTTDWFTAGNWSNGVPTSLLDAVVPTNTSPYPVIASGGDAATNSLTIGRNARLTMTGGTLDAEGNISNSGTIMATGGTVTLSGILAPQAIGGSGTTQFWGLTIANALGATQSGAVRVHAALNLASGSLTTNNRTLTLLSDQSGTALVVNTAGIVNGAATMQRAITPFEGYTGAGYHHYSSPVQATTLADLTSAPGFTPIFNQQYNTQGSTARPFPNVFDYREARVTNPENSVAAFDQGFFVPLATDAMQVMRGYNVNIGTGQVLDVRGTLNNGPQTSSPAILSRGLQPQSGWHLLGNPYPSPIDFRNEGGVIRTGMDAAIYVAQSTGEYAGQYRSYVNGMGDDALLSAMQGFFTRVSDGQIAGTFALNNAIRVTSFSAEPKFNRGASDSRPVVQLRLQRAGNSLADNTYVYFEQGATTAFDSQFDALKLPNSSGLSVSSQTTGRELSVNGQAPLTEALTLPLNVRVPVAGTYTLSAASLANFAAGSQVLLLDTQTGARINLSQQASYSFTTTVTTQPGRFSLYFGAASALAASNASLSAQVQVFPNPTQGSFTLLLPAELSRAAVQVSVLNPLGQRVSQRLVNMTAAGASAQFDVSNLPAGIYSLRISSGATQVVKRVVVTK